MMKQDWTFREADRAHLLSWYRDQKRPLPWRENRDPYRIWLSETMLQQTTTTAVIPYFQRFIARFPTLTDLARASEAEVKESWAGLGYYSRAANLWKAARKLRVLKKFPRRAAELAEYPGFGPYTSRAVASLAFGEEVGVLDGNVIRVMCRYLNLSVPWWETGVRKRLQATADAWAMGVPSSDYNQAMMELGATICTPKSPACLLCPIRRSCRAFQARTQAQVPRVRPRRTREVWLWQPLICKRGGKIALVEADGLPFLRKHLVLPGAAKQLDRKPKQFDFAHSITHHDIYVAVRRGGKPPAGCRWIALGELAAHAPSSLLRKALAVR
jgi:A/G-specific adenine glycosylase